MTLPMDTRLDNFERRLRELESELAELRRTTTVAAGHENVGLVPDLYVSVPELEPAPEPEPKLAPQYEPWPARPAWSPPRIELADLLGAKALAIAGGIVTLLGIVFFFVLAVNRGWIGPEGRVGLGAAAAVIVYGAGLELRRRYGETYSSLAAVAAGIAGGYGVLLAAAQLYHFVGHLGALVIAVAIAGLALVTALRWRSQMVAA